MAKEDQAFTIDDLAKDLDIQPASVRVALRKHGIEKPGKKYEWTTKKAYDEVVKKLRASSDKAPAKAPAKAPVKKAKAA